jgi:hypothetical protein
VPQKGFSLAGRRGQATPMGVPSSESKRFQPGRTVEEEDESRSIKSPVFGESERIKMGEAKRRKALEFGISQQFFPKDSADALVGSILQNIADILDCTIFLKLNRPCYSAASAAIAAMRSR